MLDLTTALWLVPSFSPWPLSSLDLTSALSAALRWSASD